MRAAVQCGETIYVVEGEKDAEALQALGLTETCNAMGAGKWRSSYSATLHGASVAVLPDNDPPGHQQARDICTALAGIAARCKQVQRAAALAKDYAGQFTYDLSRQAWMVYDHGRWKLHETEPPGKPTGTRPGFSPPPGGISTTVLLRPRP